MSYHCCSGAVTCTKVKVFKEHTRESSKNIKPRLACRSADPAFPSDWGRAAAKTLWNTRRYISFWSHLPLLITLLRLTPGAELSDAALALNAAGLSTKYCYQHLGTTHTHTHTQRVPFHIAFIKILRNEIMFECWKWRTIIPLCSFLLVRVCPRKRKCFCCDTGFTQVTVKGWSCSFRTLISYSLVL